MPSDCFGGSQSDLSILLTRSAFNGSHFDEICFREVYFKWGIWQPDGAILLLTRFALSESTFSMWSVHMYVVLSLHLSSHL